MKAPLVPRPHVPIAAAALCVAAGLAAAAFARDTTRAEVSERAVRTATLTPGQTLALAVTVGTVTVTGDDGRGDVRIEITRRAPSAEALARIPLDFAETPAGPRLTLTQAAGGADPLLVSDVRVTAPSAVRLDAIAIAEGRLVLRRLHGEVRAAVARGSISAEDVSGVLRLETTIGPVEVTRATLRANGLIRLRAFNGDVRLSMTGPVSDTRILALALNGRIDSDVPLTMKDAWGPRWAETSIGRPDRVISIDVVTGVIRLDAPGAR